VDLSPASPALVAHGIVKHFGRVVANEGVDFDVRFGEVHALIGENGAGKSTLMNVLYGLVTPDAGTIEMGGRVHAFAGCADAMRAGIGMVFQHFLLVDRFTVAENVLLGREVARSGFVRRADGERAVAEIAARYRFGVDARARVEELGVGARQQVELLKVLERDARIVILDEPTAALSPVEAAALFDVVRRLRDEGRAVIFIAHKLKEVLALADRITVMRRGKVVGTVLRAGADETTLATMMVGRPVDLDARVARKTSAGETILRVQEVRAARDDGAEAVRGLSLSARAGEIVGIAGVEGNGQLELVEALYGLRRIASGRVLLGADDVTHASPARHRAAGFRYVPADRQREGLVLDFDTVENALLGDQRRTARGPLLDVRGAIERAQAIARDYQLASFSASSEARSYSGGTQQKLVVGRELSADATAVLVFAPTRGVDVGAALAIYERLRTVRDAGACIVLASYDLDEIRALSDRIVVMSQGNVVGEVAPEQADDATLGRLMGGVAAGA
jgi:general nucleoside transport system ATP-binding protein